MTPPGCRAITATLLLIANFKIIRRGRRPRRPVQPCVIAKLTVYRRGGFHIRPCNLAKPPNCQEGSRPLPTNQHKNHPPQKTATPHNPPGRRGRRSLRTAKKPQQRIEIANHPIVEYWPRAGASPSTLGFLGARLRSVRAKREPKRP